MTRDRFAAVIGDRFAAVIDDHEDDDESGGGGSDDFFLWHHLPSVKESMQTCTCCGIMLTTPMHQSRNLQ